MTSCKSRRRKQKRRYQRTQVTITSGSNSRFQNKGGRHDFMVYRTRSAAATLPSRVVENHELAVQVQMDARQAAQRDAFGVQGLEHADALQLIRSKLPGATADADTIGND